MFGLYAIAFVMPLAVFGSFALIIRRHGNRLFADPSSAMVQYAGVPLAFCYGLIVLTAAAEFIGYLYSQ